ncbi:MAG: efflux RND transporter permease subunit [Acidobacteriota bacterium]|nr:efflux RND transporter permease subunit [Blastocatellia bacterium]MDW8413123.1 efflux RND transporter permease subunit [Acidobacteriota bacterium]
MQKLAEICIDRPVFATMLIAAITFIGGFSYFRLGVDQFPKVDLPTVTITTVLNGASPEEIEAEVTKRIEEAVNTVSGIDELRSVSTEGVSQVFVTFVLERDIDLATQDVRDRVNSILAELPKDIERPVIEKFDPDARPVLTLAISARRNRQELTELVEKLIKQQLEGIDGVGNVRLVGGSKRQIQVALDVEKLAAYRLTVPQVEAAIALQNLEIPAGRIDEGKRETVLRTLGRVSTLDELAKIAITNTVKLADIARIDDASEERRSFARLNGKETLLLEILKQSGENTVAVVDRVKERLAKLSLPKDFELHTVRDQSVFIKGSFEAIREHLILGGILAALVVLLFMGDWRSTFIAAVAIPTSIISTAGLMYYMDFTLNQITMLALVLSVGIVIDDAIVVLENIYRFLQEKSMSALQAAREATREIGLAVMATTLSLIVVFLPVAFMEGIVGRFLKSFGLTAAFAIAVSLLVSFTLTPTMCARLLRRQQHEARTSRIYSLIEAIYMAILRLSLRHRAATVLISIAVCAATIPLFLFVGKDFLPKEDTSDFEISVRAPEGYSLEATSEIISQIENELRKLPAVENLLVSVGADRQNTVNLANIYVKLKPLSERVGRKDLSQQELMQQARRLLSKYQKQFGLRISVMNVAVISGGGYSNTDLQYALTGPELDKLQEYTKQIMAAAAEIPGVVDLDSSLIAGKPEYRLHIDRERAADLGVRVADIASTLRTLVGGNDRVSSFREGQERYYINLRAELADRSSVQALERLYVPSGSSNNVRLGQVVRVDEGRSPARIERYNRQRQVTITANLESTSLGQVLEGLQQRLAKANFLPGYYHAPQGRGRELARTARNFAIAFVLSFVFMYMILAAQFESFVDPILILLSLPLSVPFALLSIIAFQQSLNIFSALGVLMLFGIVKKNSILQIDHANELRRRGLPPLQAVLEASRDRLRPILMTTLALVLGMVPMALGQGPGSGARRSIAMVVIGGQSLCLLLTLLITPVAYSLFHEFAERRAYSRRSPTLVESVVQDK